MKKQLSITLPKEFIELCEQDKIEPNIIIEGFIADLCEIMNWCSNPRKDGYSSNGSDERMMARAYYERVGYPYWNQ